MGGGRQRKGRRTRVPGGEGDGASLRGAEVRGQGTRVRGREDRRPRRGRAGPGLGASAPGGRTTGFPREGGGCTHVHRQLLVARGARATPAGAAQPPARGAATAAAAAAASVRHVGSRSPGPPRPRPRTSRACAGSAPEGAGA